MLESLAVVYHNDVLAKERNLSRLRSGCSCIRLTAARSWRNSMPGLAVNSTSIAWSPIRPWYVSIAYMRQHWEKLIAFLRVSECALDNAAICERALKSGNPASQELLVPQDPSWCPRGRHLHEL